MTPTLNMKGSWTLFLGCSRTLVVLDRGQVVLDIEFFFS
jgi:hypothetical protein